MLIRPQALKKSSLLRYNIQNYCKESRYLRLIMLIIRNSDPTLTLKYLKETQTENIARD